MEGVNRENLAKAHLRLVAIMQRRGPSIAEQCGVSYSVALESAVVRYVCRELIQLYCAWPETALLVKCEDGACQGAIVDKKRNFN